MKEFPSAKIAVTIPTTRRVRRVLLPGDQRDGAAPVRGSALAGVPLLGRRAAALAQGLLAPGALHRHGCGGRSSRGRCSKALPFGVALREREVRRARQRRRRPRPRSRRSGRRRSGRSALETAIESEGAPRPARAGRGRPSLAWLGVVPFFAYAFLFLFLPAGQVLFGAFKGDDGGFTITNVPELKHEPLHLRRSRTASRSASSRRSSAACSAS